MYAEKKSLDSSPDETRTFEKGKIELANLGDITIGRTTLDHILSTLSLVESK
jgi:hypothetical protein